MPTTIDAFSTVSGAVVVTGWSRHYGESKGLTLYADGKPLPTVVMPIDRPDVAVVHGAEASTWGFRACALLVDQAIGSMAITLCFADGYDLGSVFDKTSLPSDNPHDLFNDFIADVNARGGVVLEIGARARSGNESRARFAPNVRYVGCDIVAGPNVDVVADAHELSKFVTEPVDFVFSISTFEHLLMPWKAAIEIGKILRVGGRVFSHSHQSWPIHDEPWDFYRFSRDGWRGLFSAHTGFKVIESRQGDPVSITPKYNMGGSYSHMDRSVGWGMSVCLAEKISEPKADWNLPMSDLDLADYGY